MVNTVTADFLLHIVQCWHTCLVYKDNWDLPMVLYCSVMMYKYYSYFGFIPTKHNEEGKEINK